MNKQEKSTSLAAMRTRKVLVEAGLELFGSQGFEATSTRQIAQLARTNIASIAYHFGGKDGLREACAHYVGRTLGRVAMRRHSNGGSLETMSAEQARLIMLSLVDQMVAFTQLQHKASLIVPFILNEANRPNGTLPLLYEELFGPVLENITQVWAKATNTSPESEFVRLQLFAVIGPIIYFRIARNIVTKRMEWQSIGPDEAAKIAAVIKQNLIALLDASVKE
ncbi:DUF1956 domain-containing protein [Rhodobacteraceae bacterium RKSG542]|uniref:CerR family C-terminal domain-containing protein n=1 Tax=Pseudovibrio flavus TaxID=2529854 RepID=UPI0012BC8FEB|nr:CerR family C-terminal domain-containing protein [Pseudovibrio flavus]MTI17423.1 DUF1956 domain-containing protein [Pseudovibrio flavus]